MAPHDCVEQTEAFLKARQYMHNEPITADLTLFFDGSYFRDENGNHAGYGIAQLNDDGKTFSKVQAYMVSQPCSASSCFWQHLETAQFSKSR